MTLNIPNVARTARKLLFTVLCLIYSQHSLAAVALPAGELEFLSTSGNINLTSGFVRFMTIEGYLTGAVSDNFPGGFNLANTPFFMNFLLTSSTPKNGGFSHTTSGGQLTIAGGSALNALLSNLVIESSGANQHILTANLSYIGGTLVPPGTTAGSINAQFTGPVAGLNVAYPGSAGVLESFYGLIGPLNIEEPDLAVVPLPAAFWLFASVLLGLTGLKRKLI